MHERSLRREHLVLFLSAAPSPVAAKPVSTEGLRAYYEKVLAQLKGQFDEMTGTLRTIFGADTTVTPMDDLAHFTYCAKFLNPSFAERFDLDFAGQFNPALTVQENCWNSDGVGLQKIGFYLDGRFHSIFTIKRWPSRTYPGIVYRLTGLPFLDYQITVNVVPLPAKREVDRAEKPIERLRGEYESTGRHSLLVARGRMSGRSNRSRPASSAPFEASTRSECGTKPNPGSRQVRGDQERDQQPRRGAVLRVRAALDGEEALFRLVAGMDRERVQAPRSLRRGPIPGGPAALFRHLHGSSRPGRGHLRRIAEQPRGPAHLPRQSADPAAYHPTRRHGSRKVDAHAEFPGADGGVFSYTVLIEEGLSYGSFTQAMGERPIILHPDGDLTINYFDTGGMPLGQLQVATAVALVSRMIGEAPDAEAQQVRQAVFAQYIHQLYEDTFEEWSKRHRERIPEIQRLACATHRWKGEKMGLGSTEIEAFADLRDRAKANEDEAQAFVAGIREEDITAFLKNPQTERLVMALSHAFYEKPDYPVHASLVELMQFARFAEHKKEQIDHLATLLSAWMAHGQYGKLFDGETNVSLTGRSPISNWATSPSRRSNSRRRPGS